MRKKLGLKCFSGPIEQDMLHIIKNVFGTFIVKGIALVVSFFTVPAYMNFFNDNQVLGVWFVIVSILDWIVVFDLGIGSGLRNLLTISIAKKDIVQQKRLISTAYNASFILTVFFVVFMLIMNRHINWNYLLNIQENTISSNDLASSVLIVLSGIAIQMSLKNISAILFSLQKSTLNNVVNLISSLMILLMLTLVNPATVSEKLKWVSIGYVLSINIPLLIVNFIMFLGPLSNIRPRFGFLTKDSLNGVMRLGGKFFLLQIMYMILVGTNEYAIQIISSDPAIVVDYRVYARIFSLITTVFSVSIAPFWSAVTKAIAESNRQLVVKLMKTMLYGAVMVSAVQIIIIIILPSIFDLWLGSNAVVVDTYYAIAFALMSIMTTFCIVISTFANGTGDLKNQLLFYSVGIIIKLLVLISGSKVVENVGMLVVFSTFIALLPYAIAESIKLKVYFHDDRRILHEQR